MSTLCERHTAREQGEHARRVNAGRTVPRVATAECEQRPSASQPCCELRCHRASAFGCSIGRHPAQWENRQAPQPAHKSFVDLGTRGRLVIEALNCSAVAGRCAGDQAVAQSAASMDLHTSELDTPDTAKMRNAELRHNRREFVDRQRRSSAARWALNHGHGACAGPPSCWKIRARIAERSQIQPRS